MATFFHENSTRTHIDSLFKYKSLWFFFFLGSSRKNMRITARHCRFSPHLDTPLVNVQAILALKHSKILDHFPEPIRFTTTSTGTHDGSMTFCQNSWKFCYTEQNLFKFQICNQASVTLFHCLSRIENIYTVNEPNRIINSKKGLMQVQCMINLFFILVNINQLKGFSTWIINPIRAYKSFLMRKGFIIRCTFVNTERFIIPWFFYSVNIKNM